VLRYGRKQEDAGRDNEGVAAVILLLQNAPGLGLCTWDP
jgi:hypothetical protein